MHVTLLKKNYGLGEEKHKSIKTTESKIAVANNNNVTTFPRTSHYVTF